MSVKKRGRLWETATNCHYGLLSSTINSASINNGMICYSIIIHKATKISSGIHNCLDLFYFIPLQFILKRFTWRFDLNRTLMRAYIILSIWFSQLWTSKSFSLQGRLNKNHTWNHNPSLPPKGWFWVWFGLWRKCKLNNCLASKCRLLPSIYC